MAEPPAPALTLSETSPPGPPAPAPFVDPAALPPAPGPACVLADEPVNMPVPPSAAHAAANAATVATLATRPEMRRILDAISAP